MSHTPGPWQARPMGGRIILNGSNCYEVTEVFNDEGGFNPADICLMAASPDLLDAVEELLIYLADWDDPDNETCQRARAAVAKAKGERL